VPSFGMISGRNNATDEAASNGEIEQNQLLGKALTFSEEKFSIQRKQTKNSHKTHEGIVNNDSMMNINPFVPSDFHSKRSFDQLHHSSCSKEGQEVVFTMKESLRDLDAFNFSPEKTPTLLETFS